MQSKNETGRLGEQIARDYLTARGYRILQQNLRTPFGEFDLIAQTPNELVFVEVKYRRTVAFGRPEEALTRLKLAHLANGIAWYLDRFRIRGPYRLDVVAITEHDGRRTIRHLKEVSSE